MAIAIKIVTFTDKIDQTIIEHSTSNLGHITMW
jgi:hypothetical protein